jgi:hypothetical protein
MRMEKKRTKEDIVRLFIFEKPYELRYGRLGRRRKEWLSDKALFDELIKEGSVEVVDKDRKTITYKFLSPQL